MKYTKLIIALSFVGPASAVNINPGGYGEAIVLPYYTVNNGLNTLLTINNSTEQVKAIKVHFREGKEGKSVMSFNMFLAPNDMWVAGLVPHVSTVPGHINENSAAIVHSDQSCVPYLSSLEQFLPYEVDAESDDTNLKRSREGYIEILEMGELDPTSGLGEAATFDNSGQPLDCEEIEAAYINDGIWNETDGDLTDQLLPITGGLSASVGIIDVAEGTLYSYDGVAFENFYPSSSIFHTSTGDTRVPSLEHADTTSAVVDNGEVITSSWDEGYQAISALLMKNQIESFYSTDAVLDAKTEVVLSFPTKRHYAADVSPFAAIDETQDAGCAAYDVRVFDRESALLWCSDTDECLSLVLPPPGVAFQMCNSTNVLQMGSAENNQPHGILGSGSGTNLEAINGEAGKFYINFNQNVAAPGDVSYSGVPTIALAFEKYTNANATPGLLAQYGGVYMPNYKSETNSN